MSACLVETIREVPVYRTPLDILSLVSRFESCELPRAEWTHAAHLTMALWYHLTVEPGEVMDRIRAGIKRYNAAHGIVTTPTGGYHETMTVFWSAMVAKYLRELPGRDYSFVTLANGLIEKCGDKDLPFNYYTRERLFSPEARARWLPPDLKRI